LSDQALRLRKLIEEHRQRRKTLGDSSKSSMRVVNIVGFGNNYEGTSFTQAIAGFICEKGYGVSVINTHGHVYQVRTRTTPSQEMLWRRADDGKVDLKLMERLEKNNDFLFVNTINDQLSSPGIWSLISDTIILHLPFEREAAIKAYTWLKLLLKEKKGIELLILFDKVQQVDHVKKGFTQIRLTIEKFLNQKTLHGGILPVDPHFQRFEESEEFGTNFYPLSRVGRLIHLVSERWIKDTNFKQKNMSVVDMIKSINADTQQTENNHIILIGTSNREAPNERR